MNFVTMATLIAVSACLTLGFIHLRMWFKERDRWAHFLFAMIAFSVILFAVFELAMMHSTATAEYGEYLRWSHVGVWCMVVSSAFYLRIYLKAGRIWLLWLICILRTISLILNCFVFTPNLNYKEITSINQVSILGETISVVKGVPNPWMLVAQVSLFLLVIFAVDVTIAVWRRGERRRAVIAGGSMIFFIFAGSTTAVLVFWGIIQGPVIVSFFSMGLVAAMGYELSSDVLRASGLARELDESEAELRSSDKKLRLSERAARVGTWSRDISENTIRASDVWCELFEFDPAYPIVFDDFIQKIHSDDRSTVEKTLKAAMEAGEGYAIEYRILLKGGNVRWIGSRGDVENINGRPAVISGASVDITNRKLAETAAHDLTGRLIAAQEAERIRLAREIHDDLSQSTALLAIHLDVLAKETVGNQEAIHLIDNLSSDIDRLSSDLHRIAHELHPSKLQLGLESAVRDFCREVAAARKFKVDLEVKDLPRSLPDNISLCLYRVVQESLQNVGKHSGASLAAVKINANDDGISLSICDNGRGFDPEGKKATGSLGLISMRERIHAVNGTIALASTVGGGTKIEAYVPTQW